MGATRSGIATIGHQGFFTVQSQMIHFWTLSACICNFLLAGFRKLALFGEKIFIFCLGGTSVIGQGRDFQFAV